MLSISIVCFFASVFIVHADSIPQFTIMTEKWTPYNFEKNGVVQGISTDMFVLMLEKIGSKQGRKSIKIYPWVRGYKTIIAKPNTILFTTTRTKERENLFKWVGPIFEFKFNIHALKKKHIKINAHRDLRDYKIGTIRGDAYEEVLITKTGMKIDDLHPASTSLQNIKKLLHGRIDLMALSTGAAIATFKAEGINPNRLEIVFTLDVEGMYYAFHKGTPDSVIAQFQAAFDKLKKEGKLAELFSKYGK